MALDYAVGFCREGLQIGIGAGSRFLGKGSSICSVNLLHVLDISGFELIGRQCADFVEPGLELRVELFWEFHTICLDDGLQLVALQYCPDL